MWQLQRAFKMFHWINDLIDLILLSKCMKVINKPLISPPISRCRKFKALRKTLFFLFSAIINDLMPDFFCKLRNKHFVFKLFINSLLNKHFVKIPKIYDTLTLLRGCVYWIYTPLARFAKKKKKGATGAQIYLLFISSY